MYETSNPHQKRIDDARIAEIWFVVKNTGDNLHLQVQQNKKTRHCNRRFPSTQTQEAIDASIKNFLNQSSRLYTY